MMQAKRWLLWKSIHGKKIPFYANGSPRNGELDSPEDIAQLVTYEEAENVFNNGGFTGISFALGPDGTGNVWQGIDGDDIQENCLSAIANEMPGYVEVSPSGDGAHAIGYGRPFKPLGSNDSGIEAYSGGRHFTFTGRMIRDTPIGCLADYVEQILTPIHSPKSTTSQQETGEWVAPATITDLRSALTIIRADDRDTWIAVGHALKTLGDQGRSLWIGWSMTSAKWKPEDARQWDTFKPNRTSYQAVFSMAQELGWVNPKSNQAKSNLDNHSSRDLTNPGSILQDFDEFTTPHPSLLKLVDGLLGAGHTSVVFAPPSSGKTHFAAWLGVAVATGRNFCGREVTQGPVVYMSGEGVGGVRKRFQAQRKVNGSLPIKFIPDFFDFTKDYEFIAAALRTMEKPPALFIIDTLAGYFGDGDENLTKDMGRFITALFSFKKYFPDMHVLIVHHSGKERGKGMRGSSVLPGVADTIISCEKKNHGKFIAEVVKQKDGEENILFPFKLDQVEIENADGTPEYSVVAIPDEDGRQTELKGRVGRTVAVLRRTCSLSNDSIEFGILWNNMVSARDEFGDKEIENPHKSEKLTLIKNLKALRDDHGAITWNGLSEFNSVIKILPLFYSLSVDTSSI